MTVNFFDSIIMLKFDMTKVAKKEFYNVKKNKHFGC